MYRTRHRVWTIPLKLKSPESLRLMAANLQLRQETGRAMHGRRCSLWYRKDHRARSSSATSQTGTLFRASARASAQ
jgi:hypothetical protein